MWTQSSPIIIKNDPKMLHFVSHIHTRIPLNTQASKKGKINVSTFYHRRVRYSTILLNLRPTATLLHARYNKVGGKVKTYLAPGRKLSIITVILLLFKYLNIKKKE